MENRRKEKIVEIEKYLEELESFLPETIDNYFRDVVKKAACERYFEKIIEAVIDLVILIIKKRGFRAPESDRDAFEILSENNIISPALSEKLGNAKSMRNIIIHRYGRIDDKKIFDSLKNKLFNDVREFLEVVK